MMPSVLMFKALSCSHNKSLRGFTPSLNQHELQICLNRLKNLQSSHIETVVHNGHYDLVAVQANKSIMLYIAIQVHIWFARGLVLLALTGSII